MAIEIVMPRFGWTMEEGILAEWTKHDGEAVQVGDVLFTVESDKALNEVEAFETGVLRVPPDAPQSGATVRVGALLAYIVQPGERAPFEDREHVAGVRPLREDGSGGVNPPAPGGVNSPAAMNRPARHKISPRARRAADELGVDLRGIAGSGRGGRIVERDVRAAHANQPATSAGRALTTTRRVIAERMMAGVHSTAPVTLTTEVDATELKRLREQLRDDPQASALPLPGYTDLFIRLAAHALGEHPALNARLEGDTLVESRSVHIGVAVDTERGLLVPVVRDAQAKGLRQIAQETRALAEQARAGRLSADDMQGGTFTITNLGMYEIDAFTPILNLPECAILGLGRLAPKQVVVDAAAERVAIRQMMFLSLTFDHRLVDGAPAARFLQRIRQLVEQPYVWLVQ